MKNTLLILLLTIGLTSCFDNKSGMRMLFTGDVMLDRGVNDEIKLHGDSVLINSLKSFENKDFMIVNYEGTFTNSDLNQDDVYNFKAKESRVLLLKQGGVTHVSIANNHVYDFGQIGYENTLEALKKNKLIALGETCEPQIIRKGKSKCAVLSASLTTNNDSLCISSIRQLKNSIQSFKKKNPLVPLVLYIHWGLELQPKPEKWQRDLARDVIELGVDALIGHHPHIAQTIEFIDEKPVFYSIGNFIADAYLPDTDYSYTVELTVTDKIENIQIRLIKIENYFPVSINPNEQISHIKKYIAYSEGICAIQLTDGWMIKPGRSVDFQEKANRWIFAEGKIIAEIKKLQSGSHVLKLYTQNGASNAISLHGQLSELQVADINNDGNTDVLLGISKKVNFDLVIKKRINIYTYQNQNLQALWLGTKFIHNIEDFGIKKMNIFNYLTTIEIDDKGKRFQGIYEWDDFGFALTELNQIKTNEN